MAALFASIIAAGVSVYTTRTRRYLLERIWDRKVAAYVDIVSALSDLVFYYDEILSTDSSGQDMSEDRRNEIVDYWKRGYSELKRATASGTFLVSGSALQVLRSMWSAYHKAADTQDWFEMLSGRSSALRDCLEGVVKCAKSDLRV